MEGGGRKTVFVYEYEERETGSFLWELTGSLSLVVCPLSSVQSSSPALCDPAQYVWSDWAICLNLDKLN